MGELIKRDDICGGVLVKSMNTRIIPSIGPEGIVFTEHERVLIIRQMLFTVDENNLGIDSVYTSPKYKIDEIEPKCNHCENFKITYYAQLGSLLKFLKYDEFLTSDELVWIMRLITSDFGFYRMLPLFGGDTIKSGKHQFGVTFPVETLLCLKEMHDAKRIKPFVGEPGFFGEPRFDRIKKIK